MKLLTTFKLVIAAMLLGFLGFCLIAAESDFVAAFWTVWDELWGRVFLADLYMALFLFGCWAIYRDGWAKGIAWFLVFCVLGTPGVIVYTLWNLRRVKKPADMAHLFQGRHAPQAAGAATETPTERRSSTMVPRPA